MNRNLKISKYFLIINSMLIIVLSSYSYPQTRKIFGLKKSFIIQYEGMSSKLSLSVEITYQESYKTFLGDGYYFTGILKKGYYKKNGLDIVEYKIAGFCFSNSIEFGERSAYEAAKNDSRNSMFLQTYFSGRCDGDGAKNTYSGYWTLPGKGFPIEKKALLIDSIHYSIYVEANDEFHTILDFEVTKVTVLNEKPLSLSIDVIVKNKSVWFLNIDSKSGNVNGGLYIWSMEPKSSQSKNFIMNGDQNFVVTAYGLEGDTRLKNIANTVWVVATGEPCPDIKGALLELGNIFGDEIAETIKDNPQVVLTFLVKKGLIVPQTKLSQYNFIQQNAGIISNLFKGAEIVTTVIDLPKKLDGIAQWNIISKKQSGIFKIKVI